MFRQAAQAVDVQETGLKELERRREPSSAKPNGKDTEFSEVGNNRLVIILKAQY